MRHLLLLALLILAMSMGGCAAITPTEAPVSNEVSKLKPIEPLKDVKPAELGAVPQARIIYTASNEKLYAYDRAGAEQIMKLRNAALVNTELANALLETNQAQVDERNAIYRLALLEQQRANFMAERWAVTQDQLDKERVNYQIMDISYKILIGLGLIAVGL